MQQITITIDKVELLKTVESLRWKYGSATEVADNYKQVYNTKAEHGANAVDNRVLSDSFATRTKLAADMMRDFIQGNIAYDAETGSPTITLSMPDRWRGRLATLTAKLVKYVSDGMMNDWLTVTAPSEAPMYSTQLQQDETDIKVELYAKGTPQ